VADEETLVIVDYGRGEESNGKLLMAGIRMQCWIVDGGERTIMMDCGCKRKEHNDEVWLVATGMHWLDVND